MSCKSCGAMPKSTPETEFDKNVKLAQMQAKSEGKVYVVVQDGAMYYTDCLECRRKDGRNHGKIVMYVGG